MPWKFMVQDIAANRRGGTKSVIAANFEFFWLGILSLQKQPISSQ